MVLVVLVVLLVLVVSTVCVASMVWAGSVTGVAMDVVRCPFSPQSRTMRVPRRKPGKVRSLSHCFASCARRCSTPLTCQKRR